MNEFPRIPHWIPLGNPQWRDALLREAEKVKQGPPPRRGWLMDQKVPGRKDGNHTV